MSSVALLMRWFALLLSTAAAILGFVCWRSNASWVKRAMAVLTLGAALSGSAAFVLDRNVAIADDRWRATPPSLDVSLQLVETDIAKVTITSETDVPVECMWVIVTGGDNTGRSPIVGTDFRTPVKIYPRTRPGPYWSTQDIETNKIVNNYLEVRLRCWSSFYDELGSPDNLRLRKFRSYRLDGGNLTELTAGDLPQT
jgi:hypothetical protein